MLNNETLKRLKLIEQLILLEEFDQIENQVNKLKKSIENQQLILELETLVKNKSYSSLIEIIQSSIKNKSNVVEFENPTLKALKIELKQLEFELNDKNNELAELEKIIHNFDLRQNKEFGNILEQILRLKKEKLEKEKNINPKKKKDYEEAKFEYEEFHQQFENSKKEDLIELTDKQKKELKKLYREASKLCHPDIVAEKLKIQAEEIFKKLSKAYEENNIEEVKKIYDTLMNGQFNLKKSDTINETELLKLEVSKLRALIDEINKKIDDLKHTESYKLISQIDDLDKYFVKTKKDLLEELKYLQQNE
tara:strand:- start:1777 stop:2700 length:924 start_codon:yes stop_codon:yes gene_type:complete